MPEYIIDIVANAELHHSNLSYHISSYQQYLKHKYISMKFVSQDEMLDCFSTNYITLSLSLKYHYKSVTLREALKKGKQSNNTIVFEGNPGIGKSTLAVHICKKWAEGGLLQDHNAVILLPLRDPEIQGAKSISDLLKILDDEIRKSVFTEIVKSNGERICFILEGFDELPKQCMKQFSLFSKFKENLPKCTIVITSRPEAHDHIVKSFSDPFVVQICGFTKDAMDQYIASTFKSVRNGKKLAKTLRSQLNNNPVVGNIVHVPINLAIVCLIFFHFKTLPKTLTELYTLLCLRLILRHIITRTPNEEEIEKLSSLNHLPKSISEQFFQLCFCAFKCMERRNIVFYSQELLEIGIDDTKLSCLGLLHIAPTISVFGREKSYSFLHLTVQEFCAAWYISKLSTEEQTKVFKSYYYNEQFAMVWKFYSGITGLKDRQILDLMLPYKPVKSELTKIKMIKLMYHLHEAHNDEACKIVGDHCDGSFTDLYPKFLRFVTYSFDNHKSLLEAFSYFLIHYKGTLKLIDVSDWWLITDAELTVIVNSLEKRWKLLNNGTSDKLIFKLSLDKNIFQAYSLLVNLLIQHYPIIELDVQDRYSRTLEYMVSTFKQLLTKSNTLRVLDISGVRIKLKEAECLASCRNILVQDLRMRKCRLTPREADMIGEMLAHNSSIVSIDLRSNFIKEKGVERIVYHLKNDNMIQRINLCKNHITAPGINHLISSNLLQTNSSLTNLDLSHNDFKYKDVCLLLNSISITMEYIGLYGYSFVIEAIAATTQTAHNVKSLGFACYDFVDPLINTIIIQKLVVHVTDPKLYHSIMDVISTNHCLKEIKIYFSYVIYSEREYIEMLEELSFSLMKDKGYEFIKVVEELSVCLMNSNHQIEDLEMHFTSGKVGPGYHVLLGIVQSLIRLSTCIGSLKRIKATLPMRLVISLSRLQELLAEIPYTLEELTLSRIELHGEQDLQKLDDLFQEINELRSTKGAHNPLQLNIFHTRYEGFDIDPYFYRYPDDNTCYGSSDCSSGSDSDV